MMRIIKVCDTIMGAGKTQAAIKMMNESPGPFIFITIYLDEVDRILNDCQDKDFIAPKNFGQGKLDNLHNLLKAKRNIASTHALFLGYTEETAQLIRDGGYTLVMDEAFMGFNQVSLKTLDSKVMLDSGVIKVDKDTGIARWVKEGDTKLFGEFKEFCQSGEMYYYNDTFYVWEFPLSIMGSFNNIFVLTYLFRYQQLYIYFKINNLSFDYIHVEKHGEEYVFADGYLPASGMKLKDKIHIYDGVKINSVGNREFSLSCGWYEKNKNTQREKQLKNNMYNMFKNIWKVKYPDCMWTTLKARKEALTPRGYMKSFVPWNIKATNQYSDRHYLGFLINIYMNPLVKNFFLKFNVEIDWKMDDGYALSEMIQWVWRSAIRKGEEIWLYVPSARMRKLFKDWLDSVD